MVKWRILDTGIHSAQENMDIDAELLAEIKIDSAPILHFYEWDGPSATYGCFVNPNHFLNLTTAQEKGLQLGKRPTGGGIIFHLWDIAFSVVIPAGSPYFSKNTLDNYQFVNRAVLQASEEMLGLQTLQLIPDDMKGFDEACQRFCMAKPTKYDVLLNEKKIAGAAQRQCKQGFLHQGSIALKSPSWQLLEELLLPGTRVLEAMKAHTMVLLKDDQELQEGRRTMRTLLTKYLTQEFDVEMSVSDTY